MTTKKILKSLKADDVKITITIQTAEQTFDITKLVDLDTIHPAKDLSIRKRIRKSMSPDVSAVVFPRFRHAKGSAYETRQQIATFYRLLLLDSEARRVTVAEAAHRLNVSRPTIYAVLKELQLDFLRAEVTGPIVLGDKLYNNLMAGHNIDYDSQA